MGKPAKEVLRTLYGLGFLAVVFAPGVAFGFLGYWLWGDGGQTLAVAPYAVSFLIFMAYMIGCERIWKEPS